MTTPSRYSALRKKATLALLCFVIVPMLAIGILVPMQFLQIQRNQALQAIESLALNKSRAVDAFFEGHITQLRSLTEMYSYTELTAPAKLTAILHALQRSSYPYTDLAIIDQHGQYITQAGSHEGSNTSVQKENWFIDVQRQDVAISDASLGSEQLPHTIITVMRHDGNNSWVLQATMPSSALSTLLQPQPNEANSNIFLVNEKNVLQTPSRFTDTFMDHLNTAMPNHGTDRFAGQIQDKHMLLARAPLTLAPYFLIVAEDQEASLPFLLKAKALSGGILILSLAALCWATWLATRHIAKLEQLHKEKAALTAGLLQADKMAALGKRTAGIAHDIRNPLMLISQTAGWIKDLMEDEKPESMQHYQEIIQSAGKIEQHVERANAITHRLLGFARKASATTEATPLSPIIDQVLDFLHSEITQHNMTIHKKYVPDSILVTTDIALLQQVLLNIIDNAIDASPEGSEIVINTTLEDKTVTIAIQDNGSGVPKELLDNIFDPFFTTKNVGEGTGLGLSICYSIMESLGGSIQAHNIPKGGAEFCVSLPLEAKHEASTTSKPPL